MNTNGDEIAIPQHVEPEKEMHTSKRVACQETTAGAAKALAQGVQDDTSVDIERIAGAQDQASSGSSSSSESAQSTDSLSLRAVNKGSRTGPPTSGDPIDLDNEDHESSHKEYFLMCTPKRSDMVLRHVDVTRARCDYTSYHNLNREYYKKWPRCLHWLFLKEISSVDFIKFHLYWKQNVSIEEKDIGILPPRLSDEYSYSADTNPPVLRTALRHFIQHPIMPRKLPTIVLEFRGRLEGDLS
ncbi:uncharacterized protein LY89DRAFT_750603 [Mollisia scopiformis]|uniref:Uncharacterized protein n=1 Tax=Mollisia scopiformis TaxID=149040 RepID=A0A194X5D6_MOLSC|nr:uncharacterized protein LY89DRAFT_750603 [Mollisia scopiformis]KUJ15284.1 hypothetical protein LY89DRAFT_750603 [Mollisia scopiformis]